MDAMVTKAEQSEQDVRDIRRDISDTVRHIQRLTGDLDALTRKVGIHRDTHYRDHSSTYSTYSDLLVFPLLTCRKIL